MNLREATCPKTDNDIRRATAGRIAFSRALMLGYCKETARALQRMAIRELTSFEKPEECANRIVRLPPDSATCDNRRPVA